MMRLQRGLSDGAPFCVAAGGAEGRDLPALAAPDAAAAFGASAGVLGGTGGAAAGSDFLAAPSATSGLAVAFSFTASTGGGCTGAEDGVAAEGDTAGCAAGAAGSRGLEA